MGKHEAGTAGDPGHDWFFETFDKGINMPHHWAVLVGTLMVLATLVCLTLGLLIMFGVI